MRVTCVMALFLLLPAGLVAEGTEKKIQQKDLPPAVHKAIQEYSGGATVRGYSQEVENGSTYYEAELKVAGRTRDVTFDADGKLVSVEQEVALESIPAPAREAIQKGAGGGKVLLVESITKGGTTYYEAHIKNGRKEVELEVTAEGQPVAAR